MEQKHYLDIERVKPDNCVGFMVGDIVQITEKFDGSNGCIAYDSERECLVAFSRKRELTKEGEHLNGFYEWVQELPEATKWAFVNHPDWRVFGEWTNKNKIRYTDNHMRLIIYDIYDMKKQIWYTQDIVKQFAKDAGLEYINVKYEGPFISWDHVRSFMNTPAYGDKQEGVVIKNQTKLNDPSVHMPSVLKLVNDEFAEVVRREKKAGKVADSEEIKEENRIQELVSSIVTESRIEKELYKMRDEGIIGNNIEAADIPTVLKHLPKRIYLDCVKEEKDIVEMCGDKFSKRCSTLTGKLFSNVVRFKYNNANK